MHPPPRAQKDRRLPNEAAVSENIGSLDRHKPPPDVVLEHRLIPSRRAVGLEFYVLEEVESIAAKSRLRIPTQRGHRFRWNAGSHSD